MSSILASDVQICLANLTVNSKTKEESQVFFLLLTPRRYLMLRMCPISGSQPGGRDPKRITRSYLRVARWLWRIIKNVVASSTEWEPGSSSQWHQPHNDIQQKQNKHSQLCKILLALKNVTATRKFRLKTRNQKKKKKDEITNMNHHILNRCALTGILPLL